MVQGLRCADVCQQVFCLVQIGNEHNAAGAATRRAASFSAIRLLPQELLMIGDSFENLFEKRFINQIHTP